MSGPGASWLTLGSARKGAEATGAGEAAGMTGVWMGKDWIVTTMRVAARALSRAAMSSSPGCSAMARNSSNASATGGSGEILISFTE